ncbi:DUF2911 domain-containing protein [Mucilaginibacter ginsenosidivorax]|uniref:DUF2911 domain-containing protein n=1 Tax=Mucilaginibacter ginsenosidivorax TaxID=862126 RepID=A0A5B8W2W9_9SPHI|nr:DUF2911 domain-containing protein [Mucilaginibacter ginsenosidivorax]QEC77335.1 DUF2911 domain-containing protein [Mucilaginibacter ginsenosidivorax]
MKSITFKKSFMLVLFGIMMSFTVMAQEKASPAATATGIINGAAVTIVYSSPAVKGRTIWGGLVPYDKVWRAGANEATIFTTDKALTIQGKTIPAGKYSLYAVPGEKEWKIIFNSQTGQWGIKRDGSTTQDPAKDVAVVTATPGKSAGMSERLTYTISGKGFELNWENLTVPVVFN